MPTWDANLYLQFASERTQPALDLIARVGLAMEQSFGVVAEHPPGF